MQTLLGNADDAALPVAACPSMAEDDEAYPRSWEGHREAVLESAVVACDSCVEGDYLLHKVA